MSLSECRICLEKLESGIAVIKCGHPFHFNCIHRLLTTSDSCPMCRRAFAAQDVIKVFSGGLPPVSADASIKCSVEPLDIRPFTAENLHEAGCVSNRDLLMKILNPMTERNFAVVSPELQLVVDKTRKLFDTSLDLDGTGAFLRAVFSGEASASGVNTDKVEMLLAIGLNPDIPGRCGVRASHFSACGSPELAAVIFVCRPDMTATFTTSGTPLECAREAELAGDDVDEWGARCRQVAKFILDNDLESTFVPLCKLAASKKWFAVKNLIRRQIVPSSEFRDKFHGKTAAGWAEEFGEHLLAKEMAYYSSLPTAELLEEKKKTLQWQKEKEDLNAKYLGAEAEIQALKNQLAQVTGDGGGQTARPPRERKCAGQNKNGTPCRFRMGPGAVGMFCHHHADQAGAAAALP